MNVDKLNREHWAMRLTNIASIYGDSDLLPQWSNDFVYGTQNWSIWADAMTELFLLAQEVLDE